MINIKCQKCTYIWVYNGKNPYYAMCPRCRSMVSINKNKVRPITNSDVV